MAWFKKKLTTKGAGVGLSLFVMHAINRDPAFDDVFIVVMKNYALNPSDLQLEVGFIWVFACELAIQNALSQPHMGLVRDAFQLAVDDLLRETASYSLSRQRMIKRVTEYMEAFRDGFITPEKTRLAGIRGGYETASSLPMENALFAIGSVFSYGCVRKLDPDLAMCGSISFPSALATASQFLKDHKLVSA